jgi:Fe-S cluster assembly ATP-binding protein
LVFGVFVGRRCRELGRYVADGQGAGGLAAAAAAAVQDEIDSGLDVDALRDVATAVNGLRSDNNAVLMITHYQRLLDYIQPDFIHIMEAGKIVRTGGPELAAQLEEGGFASLAK